MSARKRVLIVVSSFAPAITADMHRARLLAWELPKFGWDVEIVTPGMAYQNPATIDSCTNGLFPHGLEVHEVEQWRPRLFSTLRIGSIGLRSFVPLYHRGLELLQRPNRFDLVYFSTTHFPLFCLGPLWRSRTGSPYVLDFQDPWTGARATYKTTRSAGKRALARWVNRRLERWAISGAAAFVAVSGRYLRGLRECYEAANPRLADGRWIATIPFGARAGDLELKCPPSPMLPVERGEINLVYVGAGGPNLALSFHTICSAIGRLCSQGMPEAARVRIRLFGTILGWRPGEPKFLEPVGRQAGAAVVEDPRRVEYVRSMELLREADGALVLGVDDEGYIPSKLFSYALSGKPVLACFHVKSQAYLEFGGSGAAGHVIGFDPTGKAPDPDATVAAFLQEAARKAHFDRAAALKPYLAESMAERHANLFNDVVRTVAGP